VFTIKGLNEDDLAFMSDPGLNVTLFDSLCFPNNYYKLEYDDYDVVHYLCTYY